MASAEIREKILNDVVFMGLRSAIGVIFILHGISKFSPGFAENMPNMGLPAELQIPIALAELIPGILIIIGVLSRLSASIISIVMLGAIFIVKGASSITGKGGIEIDLILLASVLTIMIVGPGRISLAQIIKKLPRCLH
ncbi:MAG: DoxX family protein [Nitrosopumilus sp.]|nr:DoxX family protein [Nitrosopumilus sp.]MDF2423942.1 DoxX family protein [Nitrosopumilus sp.]MDF2425819.1 DoxX family protein [Nitrosopumilus sp.]MDF2426362.1 DoxX family protein [Nitrosopumilus sp.]MDF2430084.1 DoxX family protein [Nitrosopumilus sp.]